MGAWWANLFDALRGSFWFVPAIGAIAAVALVSAMLAMDVQMHGRLDGGLNWLHAGDAAAVREALSTILAGTLTILTVTFSITVVALSLASTQFGPRMLRNFLQDRGTQAVMGTFVATLVYCLVILGALGRLQQDEIVPHTSMFVALLLTLVSVAMLIFFFHHITHAIQASSVIAAVSVDLEQTIDRMFPHPLKCARSAEPVEADSESPRAPAENAAVVRATTSGFLQAIDFDSLAQIARRRDLTVRVYSRAGAFVMEGEVIMDAAPMPQVNEACAADLRRTVLVGTYRNPTQDVEFCVRQLVEIALRALSPAVNDPFTAMDCVDRLGAAIARMAGRDLSGPYHLADVPGVRIAANQTTFAGVVNTAFDQLRQQGRSNAALTIHMLDTLARVASHVKDSRQRQALRDQAEMIHRGGMEALPEERDRQDVTVRYRLVLESLTRNDRPAVDPSSP